jgi:hypothetical protein
MDEPVQGQEPQGGEPDGGIFAPYLDAVPQEHRDTVAGYLKDAEKNVNDRISKASELEKTLGPYKDVQGLDRYQPEDLSQLLAWHQEVTSSDEAFQNWLAQTAGEAGFTKAETEQLEDLESEGAMSQQQIEKLVTERAEAQVQPIRQEMDSWRQERALNDETVAIQTGLKQVETDNNVELNQEQQEAVLKLGEDLEGDDWVAKGYARYAALVGAGQKAFVDQKVSQPPPAVSAGGQEAFKATTSFAQAGEQLRERMRNST